MNKKEGRAEHARRSREKRNVKRARSQTGSPKPTLDTKAAQPNRRRRRFRGWGRIFLAAMTTIGGASAAYVLYELRPKVRITEGHSLDEHNPLETQFIVTNDSAAFDLRDVEARCSIADVRTDTVDARGFIVVDPSSGKLGTISPGESAAAPCGFNAVLKKYGSVRSADIAIEVEYGYFLWQKRLLKKSRFITRSGKDGTPHWFPSPK